MNDELLTIKETAAYMKVSVRAVFYWIKLGRVTPMRSPSGRAMFSKQSLLRSMERHEFGGNDKPNDPSMG